MTEENKQEQVQEISYAEYVRPLVSTLRDAVIKIQEENEGKYNEFDIYNGLALTITMLVSRNIPEDERETVNAQSQALARHMVESTLRKAGEEKAFLSAILIAASRSVTNLVEIVEANLEGQEKQEQSVEVQE